MSEGERQRQEMEALYQALLKAIPTVRDAHQLRESAALALDLMLRREGDTDLRHELALEIDSIISGIPIGSPPEKARNELRFAAMSCVKVLKAARGRRLPRTPAANWAFNTLGGGRRRLSAGKRHRRIRAIALTTAFLVVVAGLVAWQNAEDDPDLSPGAELAEQMLAASPSGYSPTHVLGGPLRLDPAPGGGLAVTAEAVPGNACVAAAWRLAKQDKGMLTINGVTPRRISGSRLAQLCAKGADGLSTLTWTP